MLGSRLPVLRFRRPAAGRREPLQQLRPKYPSSLQRLLTPAGLATTRNASTGTSSFNSEVACYSSFAALPTSQKRHQHKLQLRQQQQRESNPKGPQQIIQQHARATAVVVATCALSSHSSSSSSSQPEESGTGNNKEMADPREFQTGSCKRLFVHEGILPQRARGAVFDMDGTLLDTNDRRVESWQAACGKRGLKIDKSTYMDVTGMSGRDIVDKLCADQGVDLPPEERQALVEEENRTFKEKGLPQSPAVSPVLDVLEEAQRRGLRLAVCSGGHKDAVERALAERGLADRFQAVVTSADVPHAKPEPDIFLLAAERLGLRPEECVAFEDARIGKMSARAAGYLAVVDVTGLPGHPDK